MRKAYPRGQRLARRRADGRATLLVVLTECLLAVLPATAEQPEGSAFEVRPPFSRLSIDDGLSQSVVTALLQDRHGFLWVGTQDGLNRYDGYSFQVYRSNPDEPHSVAGSYVLSLLEDSTGVLWVGTTRGLSRFDPVRAAFTTYRPDPARPGTLSQRQVFGLAEDPFGFLWVATGDGLDRVPTGDGAGSAPAADAFVVFRHDPADPTSLARNGVSEVLVDAAGTLWVGSEGGGGLDRCLLRPGVDPGEVEFEHYRHLQSDHSSLAADVVLALHEDPAEQLWVGTKAGLCRFDRARERFECTGSRPDDPRSLSDDAVWSLGSDSHGTLWVGTAAGLNRRRADGSFERHLARPRATRSLDNDFVNALACDASGVLWIGTDAGLERLDTAGKAFRNLFPGLSVWAVLRDRQGWLWVGTSEGLFGRRPDGRVVRYRHDPGDPASLSDNTVWTLAEDRGGALWVGTFGGGLDRLDPDDGTIRRYVHDPRDPASLSAGGVTSVLHDSHDTLWVGTLGGLDRVDPETGAARRYRSERDDPTSLVHSSVVALLEATDGSLWVGTQGGLDRYDRSADSFQHFRHDPASPKSLREDHVLALAESRDGALWVATSGGGLNRYDPASASFTAWTERDGLPNNVVNAVLEDEQGRLWLSTNRGLARFDRAAGAFRSYFESDGLQSNEFNFRCAMRDGSGDLYFGGVNGLTAFRPAEIADNPVPPPVVLTSFAVFNREVDLPRPLQQLDQVVLGWRDDVITFGFAALSYNDPARNQYAYRLDGFDRDWNLVGHQRSATYTNLDPGRYLFRVKAANNDGVWNQEGASVRLVVTPPFWLTWWFRTGALLAVALLLATGHRLRVRALERRRRELEALVEQRTRELESKRSQLEKTNNIVTAINSEMQLVDLLSAILEQTRIIQGSERATFLVRDQARDRFRVCATRGFADNQLAELELDAAEARQRYLSDADEIHPGIFVIRQVAGRAGEDKVSRRATLPRSMLVMTMSAGEAVDGLLVLENTAGENPFDRQDVELLYGLQQHVLSAFAKTRLLQEMRDLSDKKSEVLRIAAHDLRSPLATVITVVQLIAARMREGQVDLADAAGHLERVLDLSHRTLELLERLLDLSAIEAGRVELVRTRVDLWRILEECETLHRETAAEKRIELTLARYGTLPEIQVDPLRIKEVVDNLVSNAIKYTHPGGSVRLSSTTRGAEVVTSVADTGQGLGPEDMEQVFRSFRTLSARPTGGEPSTGLGLAIAKGIVELHGGRIWVESTKGHGATFSFALPLPGGPGGTDHSLGPM